VFISVFVLLFVARFCQSGAKIEEPSFVILFFEGAKDGKEK
jgi:hypothetical protein